MTHFFKFIFTILLLASCSNDDTTIVDDIDDIVDVIDDDLDGPISRPASGYGSDGPYSVAKVTLPSPDYPGKEVEIFYPEGITSPVPTIFYSHPYSGEESEYNIGLYEFIAKKGYAVVFSPYRTFDISVISRNNTLWLGFKAAVDSYPNIIDTQKVGFMGHSYGGSATFTMAYKGFVEEGWGENGRLIFAQAQWYLFQMTQTKLQSFPSNTKLITQIFDDDTTNDHRMAIDVFKNINIPNSEKDFILVKESILPEYTYRAGHNVPSTYISYDAYDYYVIYRLLDALIDYSFNGNVSAKATALGNGSVEQITMPSYNGQALEPLIVTDDPSPLYNQDKYLFPCTHPDGGNIREDYCE